MMIVMMIDDEDDDCEDDDCDDGDGDDVDDCNHKSKREEGASPDLALLDVCMLTTWRC